MLLFQNKPWARLFFAFFILFASAASANTIPFNWTQLDPSSSPTARDFPSMAFDPSTGQMMLFGGSQNGSSLNDTWVFNTTSNSWIQLTPSSSPSSREAASMVFDPCTGQIILFGGWNNGNSLNDTWAFDITTSTWTELSPAVSPSARYGASIAFDPSSGQIILFGGENNGTFLDDTWAFNAQDHANTWTNLTPSTPPSAREGASMAFNPSSGQIILFGGDGSSGLLNDTWAFNTLDNANTWTNLNPSHAPTARYGASMDFNPSNGQMILFGGNDESGLVSDTWQFEAQNNSNTWTELTLSTAPTARYGAAMNFDPSNGQMILFGGSGSGGDLNDTWAYGVPSNAVLFWNNQNPSTSPPTRFSPCFTFDPTSGQMILFGGINGDDGTYFNDTWAYDASNNTWTDLAPANSPSARDSALMNFDPCTGKIILFSGHVSGGYAADTWVYDSANNTWTEVTPSSSPPGRNGGSMTFDPCSGRMILFGGYLHSGGDTSETWAYDAAANTWTQLTTIGSPPARDDAAMNFDPSSGQIILFGGYSNNTGGNLLNDTWACVFDNTTNTYTWTQLFPATQPSGRYGSAMKFNPSSGQTILFGGGYLSGTSNDTWAFDGQTTTWTELNPIDPPEAREFAGFDFNPTTGQMILFGGVNLPSDLPVGDTQALAMGLSPQITSGNEATFEVGEFSSYTVTTSGFPDPMISETGTLPAGVTFVDNGNGTATLSGTPNPDSVEVYGLTFTASNGLSPAATQNFTFVVLPVLPPTHFNGVVTLNMLSTTQGVLTATWDASSSPDIVYYLVYKNGILVQQISASSPLVFATCVNPISSATEYQIAAVNSNDLVSPAVPITIVSN